MALVSVTAQKTASKILPNMLEQASVTKWGKAVYSYPEDQANPVWNNASGKYAGYTVKKAAPTDSQQDIALQFENDASPDLTAAQTFLDATDIPTCAPNGLIPLRIDVTFGTLIVLDTYTVVPDALLTTYVLVALAIDDTTKIIETLIFTKTSGNYADLPAGKTLLSYLKEYSCPALGTQLTETVNYIE